MTPRTDLENTNLLKDGAHALGVVLSDEQLAQFSRYKALLEDWNTKLNLTRILGDDVVPLHFLDSLASLTLTFDKGAKVLDLGTGAGFPGIPIKIARPDIKLTLVDSLLKKLKFLDEAIRTLGLQSARTVHARAEDLGHEKSFREAFDVVTARAVAPLAALAELMLPLVRQGGFALALKSENTSEEAQLAEPIVEQLGGRFEEVEELAIPGTDLIRRLIVMRKIKETPSRFPRKPGQTGKKPGKS